MLGWKWSGCPFFPSYFCQKCPWFWTGCFLINNKKKNYQHVNTFCSSWIAVHFECEMGKTSTLWLVVADMWAFCGHRVSCVCWLHWTSVGHWQNRGWPWYTVKRPRRCANPVALEEKFSSLFFFLYLHGDILRPQAYPAITLKKTDQCEAAGPQLHYYYYYFFKSTSMLMLRDLAAARGEELPIVCSVYVWLCRPGNCL